MCHPCDCAGFELGRGDIDDEFGMAACVCGHTEDDHGPATVAEP